MIRLSRLTDYAVALLALMGKGDALLWAAPEITAQSGLPLPTVSKILKLLAKAGLVTAHRGAAGGYRLARPVAQISIADVIEAMDGPIALTDCSEGSAHEACGVERICPVSQGWNKVNRAVKLTLSTMSLAELNTPSYAMQEAEAGE